MSLQDAFNFIQRVGEDEPLKDRIRAMGRDVEIEEVVKIGVKAGFEFTAAELRTAFAKDWTMRMFFYSGRTPNKKP